MQDYGAVEFFK